MAENVSRRIPDARLADASLRLWRKSTGPIVVGCELTTHRDDVGATTTTTAHVTIEDTLQQARAEGIFASDAALTTFQQHLTSLRDWLRAKRNWQP